MQAIWFEKLSTALTVERDEALRYLWLAGLPLLRQGLRLQLHLSLQLMLADGVIERLCFLLPEARAARFLSMCLYWWWR